MLEFCRLTLSHLPLVREDLDRDLPRTCDYSVGGILLWRDYLGLSYAKVGDAMVYSLCLPDGTRAFQMPADGNPDLLRRLYDFCAQQGEVCRFAFVPAEKKDIFFQIFPHVTVEDQREWYDYLYRKDDLITYAGKKLRGQRNHVNKFRASYPDWAFHRATEEDLPPLRDFYRRFREENQKDAPSWKEEEKKIEEIFDHFSEYAFLCGILTVGDAIAGFSLGEYSGDTLIVHTEKADRNLAGAYPMLASRFVETFAHEGIRYVNREDDSGDEGLRTAKLSYHPCALLEKSLITLG